METKKGKIVKVTGNGTWQSANGLFYKWEVEFDNGDLGGAMTKDQNQQKWIVGKEVSYTKTVNDKGFSNFKLVEEKPFSGGKFEPKDTGVITMLSCISSACNAVAQSADYKNVTVIKNLASEFFTLAMSKSNNK